MTSLASRILKCFEQMLGLYYLEPFDLLYAVATARLALYKLKK